MERRSSSTFILPPVELLHHSFFHSYFLSLLSSSFVLMSFQSFEIVEKLMIAKKGEAKMKECQELVDQMTNALSDAKSKLAPLEAKCVL